MSTYRFLWRTSFLDWGGSGVVINILMNFVPHHYNLLVILVGWRGDWFIDLFRRVFIKVSRVERGERGEYICLVTLESGVSCELQAVHNHRQARLVEKLKRNYSHHSPDTRICLNNTQLFESVKLAADSISRLKIK